MRVRFRKPEYEPAVLRCMDRAGALTGFTMDELRGRSHKETMSKARHGIMAALNNAGFSSVEIGELFDRDHSTILEAVRNVKTRRKLDAEYDKYVGELGRAIG